MSELRVCRDDGEPLVFTFEFPGAEYVCGVCGLTDDIFAPSALATAEMQLRHDALVEEYDRAYAERRGVPYRPRPKTGDAGVRLPTCRGCGAEPPIGVAVDASGKPSAWLSRTVDGVTEYVCSRTCIPSGEPELPW